MTEIWIGSILQKNEQITSNIGLYALSSAFLATSTVSANSLPQFNRVVPQLSCSNMHITGIYEWGMKREGRGEPPKYHTCGCFFSFTRERLREENEQS